MAGDWMKIELELPDKPEVHQMAKNLDLDPDAVVGKLIRVWQWFNKHTTDGNAVGVTYLLLDRITYVTGFAESMALVGWLVQKNDTLHMPKFDVHTSESAKKRAQTAKRVAKQRVRSVQECNAVSVTKSEQTALPREEKRRKDNKDDFVHFDEFWKVYPNKQGKERAKGYWSRLSQQNRLEAISDCQKRFKGTEKKYIPHGSSYLSKKYWKDELPAGDKKPLRWV